MLIIGDDESRLVPLRARPQCLVDLLDKPLAPGDVVRRVVVVGRKLLAIEVPLLDDDVIGQLAPGGVELEPEAVLVELEEVLEPAEALVEERGRDVLVVDAEGEAVLLEAVEDGLLREAVDEVLAGVEGEAVGGGGVDEEPVGLRGGGHGREPAVEDGELVGERGVDGDGVGREAAHDVLRHAEAHAARVLREARHRGRDCRGVGGAEDLLADVLEAVAGVGVDVAGLVGDEDLRGGGVGRVEAVGLLAGEPVDVGAAGAEPAEDVVEAAVLHDHHHHRLDRGVDLALLAAPLHARAVVAPAIQAVRRDHQGQQEEASEEAPLSGGGHGAGAGQWRRRRRGGGLVFGEWFPF
ncbi:hypothetical protein CFC21_054466 [Triticum aestivum]|uniref:Uncharacterized protein n=2 Tax=Triticum aestivum TaxID=4565 RepID=A0A9R1K921_WHEAT|nr:hypothetical protein CFC21_054466 [Triticum aestivum]